MAKPNVRTVVVKRGVTIFLLLLTTIAMAGITLSLSGKAYSKVDPVPFREVRLLYEKLSEGPTPMPVVIALTMPIILNILLFMPWGFLMFITLDHGDRPALQSYVMTFLFATGLSLAVEAWQYFLPTRVTDINDVIWNASGAVLGAIFGHLRKRIRVAFE
jgi:glycopeptide antibiotics resistance protein